MTSRRSTRKANLFVIGAPKCGTTTLYRILAFHPNIFMSDPKEPWFFANHLSYRPIISRKEYESLFANANESKYIYAGEASVVYYIRDETIERIMNYNEHAKFIYMVRNPVDFVFSWHAQMLRTGQETLRDPVAAWSAQEARARGHRIPWSCANPELLLYRRMARLGSRGLAIEKIVPEENLLIVHMNDLIHNYERIRRSLSEFLGLEDHFPPCVPKTNPRRVPRWIFLNQTLSLAARLTRPLRLRIPSRSVSRFVHRIVGKTSDIVYHEERAKEFRSFLENELRSEIDIVRRWQTTDRTTPSHRPA